MIPRLVSCCNSICASDGRHGEDAPCFRGLVESVQARLGAVSLKHLSTRCMEAGGGIERTHSNAFAIRVCGVTIARRAAWGRRWSRQATSEPASNYFRSGRLTKTVPAARPRVQGRSPGVSLLLSPRGESRPPRQRNPALAAPEGWQPSKKTFS